MHKIYARPKKTASSLRFNDLPVGAIAEFNGCEFVKLQNADPNKIAPMQFPNAVDLDSHHYIVIAAHAECKLLKRLEDYPPRDLFHDLER